MVSFCGVKEYRRNIGGLSTKFTGYHLCETGDISMLKAAAPIQTRDRLLFVILEFIHNISPLLADHFPCGKLLNVMK